MNEEPIDLCSSRRDPFWLLRGGGAKVWRLVEKRIANGNFLISLLSSSAGARALNQPAPAIKVLHQSFARRDPLRRGAQFGRLVTKSEETHPTTTTTTVGSLSGPYL